MSPGLATILRSVSVRFEVPSHQVVTGPLLFVIESKSTGRGQELECSVRKNGRQCERERVKRQD
jgi:hypothetical protein